MPDLCMDLPNLTELIANGVILPLLDDKKLDLGKIVWLNQNEDPDLLSADSHYVTVAYIMNKWYENGMEFEDIKSLWNSQMGDAFIKMSQYVMDRNDVVEQI